MRIEENKNTNGKIVSVFVRDMCRNILRAYCVGSNGAIISDDRTGKYHVVEDTPLKELSSTTVREYEKKVYRVFHVDNDQEVV